jgi:hypothetical protein
MTDKDQNPNIIKLTGPVREKPKPLSPKEMTPEQRAWKIKMLEEHLDQLYEAIHYAKQDVAKFAFRLDISHSDKRKEAERAVADSEKEIEQIRTQISDLRAV